MTVDELNAASPAQLREYMTAIDRQLEVENDRNEYRHLTDLWWKCRYKAEAKESAMQSGQVAIHPWRVTAKKEG